MYIQSTSRGAPRDQLVERFTTEDLLRHEFEAIRGAPPTDAEFKDEAATEAAALTALCLSGGGIRSAAFALGVAQALARRGLLTSFDYLSTVSGGGYLGGFIQRLAQSTPDGSRDENIAQAKLAARLRDNGRWEINRLREFSNFITPRIGMLSDDSWTALAISARNILLNWLLFAPLFALLTILPQLYMNLLMVAGSTVGWVALGVEFVSLVWAAAAIGSALPTNVVYSKASAAFINRHIVVPLVVFSLSVPFIVASPHLAGEPAVALGLIDPFGEEGAPWPEWTRYLVPALVSVIATMFGFALTASNILWRGEARIGRVARDMPLWFIASLFGAALFVGAGAATSGYFQLTEGGIDHAPQLAAIGPVGVMAGVLLVGVFVSAGRSVFRDAMELLPDLDREWLARLSAVAVKPTLAWLLLAATTLIVGEKLGAFDSDAIRNGINFSEIGTYFVSFGAVWGFVAAITGRSSATTGFTRKLFSLEIIVAVATLAFAIFAIAGFGLLEVNAALALAAAMQKIDAIWWLNLPEVTPWHIIFAHILLGGILIALLVGLGYVIDINRFSLNGFYRNRISRAFLGAAREGLEPGARGARQPDPFTGFDAADNARLSNIWPESDGKRRSLYPVINVALNAVATQRLAWQERKAQPFVLTPIACGSAMLEGFDKCENSGLYIHTKDYGSREQDERMPGTGITLAAALAISGAAVSPNMGYHSSPAATFLMTLFNLRLGAWLPNPSFEAGGPGDPATRPRNSIALLIRELLGLTNDQNPDIYLSDGGHFENLGLYEMVRRRCRYIVLVDAGCDPLGEFADLGNAIRKCAIDLQTDIRFPDIDPANSSVLLGRVCYPDFEGQILYIKPHLPADAPIDIAAYARSHDSFPHEATTDQWYSESQFESYRHLGEYIFDKRAKSAPPQSQGLDSFFAALSASRGAAKAALPKTHRASRARKVQTTAATTKLKS